MRRASVAHRLLSRAVRPAGGADDQERTLQIALAALAFGMLVSTVIT